MSCYKKIWKSLRCWKSNQRTSYKILVRFSHACDVIFAKSMKPIYVKLSDSLTHISHIPDKLKFLQNNHGARPVFLATSPISH